MEPLHIFAALSCSALLLIIILKLTVYKKKKLPKPSEVQKNVAYDERYPNRAKILNKEYNLEEDKPDDETP